MTWHQDGSKGWMVQTALWHGFFFTWLLAQRQYRRIKPKGEREKKKCWQLCVCSWWQSPKGSLWVNVSVCKKKIKHAKRKLSGWNRAPIVHHFASDTGADWAKWCALGDTTLLMPLFWDRSWNEALSIYAYLHAFDMHDVHVCFSVCHIQKVYTQKEGESVFV